MYWKNDKELERIIPKFLDKIKLSEKQLQQVKVYLIIYIDNFEFNIDKHDLDRRNEEGEIVNFAEYIKDLSQRDLFDYINQLKKKHSIDPF